MWDDGHTSLQALLELLADEAGARFVPGERLEAEHSAGRGFRRNDLRREPLQLLREASLERPPLGIGAILGGKGT